MDLARTRRFEDVWHLLLHGDLPDARRSAAFAAEAAALRVLPEEVAAALPALAAVADANPLAGMRTALSLLGAVKRFRPVYDLDADRRREDGRRRLGRTDAAHRAVPAGARPRPRRARV